MLLAGLCADESIGKVFLQNQSCLPKITVFRATPIHLYGFKIFMREFWPINICTIKVSLEKSFMDTSHPCYKAITSTK